MVVGAFVAVVVGVGSVSPVSMVAAGGGDTFVGLNPARVLDTRAGASTIDGVAQGAGAVGAGSVTNVTVAGRGGVPATGVGAVALNVTAVGPTVGSYLTVWPAGAPQPNASNLNLQPGVNVPNMVIVPVGADGQISIYNFAGTTHLLVDVLGWFPVGSSFTGLNPARVLDTRPGASTIDGVAQGAGAVGAGSVTNVKVAGRGGVPATGVGAVALNVTAVGPTVGSYLTVWPTGAAQPNASNLNLQPGVNIPNMVIVPVGADGQISIYNFAGTTDLLVDVLGWFPVGSSFTGLNPARVLDTRPGASTIDGVAQGAGAVGAGSVTNVTVAGRGGVPATGVGAVALNVTAVGPTVGSYLTVWPAGASQPNASNLNLQPGVNVPNMVIVPVGADGQISIFNAAGTTHLLVDVLGWFPTPIVAGNPRIVSVKTDGTQGNDNSSETAISADGRYVAFSSVASNLVEGDNNAKGDVFVRDTSLGTTTLVSVNTNGTQGDDVSYFSAISADGRYVAFTSFATTLVEGDNNGEADVFVRDTSLGTTTLVSVSTNGIKGNDASYDPAISADGQYIAFTSAATGLVLGDLNNKNDVFVRDTLAETTTLVSVNTNGTQGDDVSFEPAISADGQYIAFSSDATSLIFGDINAKRDVYLRDTINKKTTRVSISNDEAESNGASGLPAISADGTSIAFASYATGLVGGDNNAKSDVFVRNTLLGNTTLVSVSTNGTQGNFDSGLPAISADGRYITFFSAATGLVFGDLNNKGDVFVHDTNAETTTLVSVSTNGTQGNNTSQSPVISADGTHIAFTSTATNLSLGDLNNKFDVFVYKL